MLDETAMRTIKIVDARSPRRVKRALDDAMHGRGPAILARRSAAEVVSIGGAVLDEGGDDGHFTLPDDAPEDACLIVETSGSTAQPKRVVLTASALRSSANATHQRFDELAGRHAGRATRQWLLALPTEYVAGMQVLARSIIEGTEPIILPEGSFDPREFCDAAQRMTAERRYVSLVPAQVQRLIELGEVGLKLERERDLDAHDNADGWFAPPVTMDAIASGEPLDEHEALGDDVLRIGRRFDAILVGGQATPGPWLNRGRELGWRVVTSYGSSETSGGCVYNGIPLDGVSLRLNDDELEISSPTLAWGYLDDEARTAERFTSEGEQRWYRTGDRGALGPRSGVRPADVPPEHWQRVRVYGRMDDVFISGGVKVRLGAVEEIVRAQPGFEGAVVVPGPHERWGEVPIVVVTGDPEHPGDLAEQLVEIRAEVRAEVGVAARPDDIIEVSELPLLGSGKPDRRRIADFVREHIEARYSPHALDPDDELN